MKRVIILLLTVTILFSFVSCNNTKINIEVEDGIVSVSHTQSYPDIILLDAEERLITDKTFFEKIVKAIDGKPIKSEDEDFHCECDIEYKLKINTNYANGYYFLFHEHGIEIQGYCKFRKCLNLYGIVEIDESTMSELLSILESV